MKSFIKGGTYMVLITLLLLMVIILIVATLIVLSVGGAVGVILFGDVIVCILVLIWLLKKLLTKH